MDFCHAVKILLINGKLSSDDFVPGFFITGNNDPIKVNKRTLINVKAYIYNCVRIILICSWGDPDICITLVGIKIIQGNHILADKFPVIQFRFLGNQKR